MFLREKKNKSGSVSVQIIQKLRGKYKVLQTIGNGKTEQELIKLKLLIPFGQASFISSLNGFGEVSTACCISL